MCMVIFRTPTSLYTKKMSSHTTTFTDTATKKDMRRIFFDSRTSMSAGELKSWRIPRKYRREDGMYGSAGKFAIAANIGNRFRIYEYYTSQKEADDAIALLKNSDILTACDLYVVLLDAWIPVPFESEDTTAIMSSEPEKNPFQAHLDAINSETEQVQKNLVADKGKGKTAYELYRTSIHTTAMKVLKKAVGKIMTNMKNNSSGLSLLRKSAGERKTKKEYDARMAQIGLAVSNLIDEAMSKEVMLEFKRLRNNNNNDISGAIPTSSTTTDQKGRSSMLVLSSS